METTDQIAKRWRELDSIRDKYLNPRKPTLREKLRNIIFYVAVVVFFSFVLAVLIMPKHQEGFVECYGGQRVDFVSWDTVEGYYKVEKASGDKVRLPIAQCILTVPNS